MTDNEARLLTQVADMTTLSKGESEMTDQQIIWINNLKIASITKS